MHLLLRMKVMLDFNYMDSVKLRNTREGEQVQNYKFLPTVGFEPTTLIFVVRLATDRASQKLSKDYIYK